MSFATFLFAAAVVALHPTLPAPPDPTLHVFRESMDGGVQQVVANSGASSALVGRMRRALHDEIPALERGEFPDPVGPGKTPAVAMLRSAAGHLEVTYQDIPRGGQLRYRSRDAKVISALHEWMAATVQAERKLHPGGPGEGGE
jgi:hypothetical protein